MIKSDFLNASNGKHFSKNTYSLAKKSIFPLPQIFGKISQLLASAQHSIFISVLRPRNMNTFCSLCFIHNTSIHDVFPKIFRKKGNPSI